MANTKQKAAFKRETIKSKKTPKKAITRDKKKVLNYLETQKLQGEQINHPSHYGGKDNPYEAIKVIRAWGMDKNFCLGNALKYISRAGKKDPKTYLEDLKKAAWYLQDEIKHIEGGGK